MTGARDVFIHNYMDINLEVVWKVAKVELARVKRGIEAILDDEQRGWMASLSGC